MRARPQRAELLEQLHPRLHVALVRRLDEREAGDVAEPEAGHLEDDAGEVGAQDLGLGELRAPLEVLLGVETDGDAGLEPAAAARALVGRGLADRLDREPLHLGPHGVAADPRDARVHDVPDAGHGQRGLGDVRRQHDAATGVRAEDPVLLGRRQPRVERDDLGARQVGQGVRGVPDLPLAGQEHQDVAGPLGGELLDRVDDRLGLVPDDRLALLVLLRQLDERPVADLDRVGPAGHLDDGCVEVLGEPLDVDGRAGDHDLEVGPARQQLLEVAEQEVDVERPLVGLVDDDRVVLLEVPVALQLGEQDAVGHQLHAALLRRPVGEPHLVADQVAQLGPQLARDPLGDRARGDPPRLGVPDDAAAAVLAGAPPELETDLGQLGGLARPRLARDDHDLVVADGLGDVLAALADGELGRVRDRDRLH